MSSAILIIDVQRDFCKGGALAAEDTSSLLAPLNAFVDAARTKNLLVVLTQDWHPLDHCSFRQNGGPWPVHCVAGSTGAEFMPPLAARPEDLVVPKGVQSTDDSYSMFDDTSLAATLRARGIERLSVCGIATEYCVLETVKDAISAGFKVTVMLDLVRPVNRGDGEGAIVKMRNAGAVVMQSGQWLSELKVGGIP